MRDVRKYTEKVKEKKKTTGQVKMKSWERRHKRQRAVKSLFTNRPKDLKNTMA